jgi:hypothetical protein
VRGWGQGRQAGPTWQREKGEKIGGAKLGQERKVGLGDWAVRVKTKVEGRELGWAKRERKEFLKQKGYKQIHFNSNWKI